MMNCQNFTVPTFIMHHSHHTQSQLCQAISERNLVINEICSGAVDSLSKSTEFAFTGAVLTQYSNFWW